MKHPMVLSWEDWLASEEGLKCKGGDPVYGQYLTNRLQSAFYAGYDAGKTSKS